MGKPISMKSLSVLGVSSPLIPNAGDANYNASKKNEDHYEDPNAVGGNGEEFEYQNPEDYVSDNNDENAAVGIPMSSLVKDFPVKAERFNAGADADDMRAFIGNGDANGVGMNEELRSVLEESSGEGGCGHHHGDEIEIDEDFDEDEQGEVTATWENDSDEAESFLAVLDWRGRPLFFYDPLAGNPEYPEPDKVNGYYGWLKHLIPNIIFRTANPAIFMNENQFLAGGRFINFGKDPGNKKLTQIAFYYISEEIDEDMLKILTYLFNEYIDGTPLSHFERSKSCEELIASDEETDQMLKDFIGKNEAEANETEPTEEAGDDKKQEVDFDAIASDVAAEYGADNEETTEEEGAKETTTEEVAEETEEAANEEAAPEDPPKQPKKTTAKKTSAKSSTAKKSSTSAKKAAAADKAADDSDDKKENSDGEMIVETIRKPGKKS